MEVTIDQLIKDYKLYLCVDCGKCVGSCPMTEIFEDYSSSFSPRNIIERALLAFDLVADKSIWYCLTCNECTVKCPQGVEFRDFINTLREIALKKKISRFGIFCKRCGQYFLPVHTIEYIRAKLNDGDTDIELLNACPRCRKYEYGEKVKALSPMKKIISDKSNDNKIELKKKKVKKKRNKNGK